MTIATADVLAMVPFARQLDGGVLFSADDCSITGLAMAHVNAERRAPGWCSCPVSTIRVQEDRDVYYRDANTGRHGWMCGKCCRTTQTG